MNKLAMIILIVLISGTSCKTITPVTSGNDSLLMIIDCRDDIALRQTIVMYMRSSRVRDITVTPNAGILTIKGAFTKMELPLSKLNQLSADIENLGGVIEMRVEENRGVIMQTLDRVPYPDRSF